MNAAAVFMLLFAVGVAAHTEVPADSEPPLVVAEDDWRPLLAHTDRRLQRRLEQRLGRNARLARLIARRKLAIGLVDLRIVDQPRYARVNGDVMMYAASLPKIAILLAAFDHFDKGLLDRSAIVDRDLHDMIRVSNNAAATRMIDRLGGLQEVNAVLMDPRFHFYDKDGAGGLWVGKRYAKLGRRQPDPVFDISHGATVGQVCRFYYQLATGRLISRDASREMLEILADPDLSHKFVKTLKSRAPAARLYRKSGTYRHWHSDSVLVWGPQWRRYILVALVESPAGGQVLERLVAVAEQVLKPDMRR